MLPSLPKMGDKYEYPIHWGDGDGYGVQIFT